MILGQVHRFAMAFLPPVANQAWRRDFSPDLSIDNVQYFNNFILYFTLISNELR